MGIGNRNGESTNHNGCGPRKVWNNCAHYGWNRNHTIDGVKLNQLTSQPGAHIAIEWIIFSWITTNMGSKYRYTKTRCALWTFGSSASSNLVEARHPDISPGQGISESANVVEPISLWLKWCCVCVSGIDTNSLFGPPEGTSLEAVGFLIWCIMEMFHRQSRFTPCLSNSEGPSSSWFGLKNYETQQL